MKVFKFGGASIGTANRIRGVAGIIRLYPGEKTVVVISAMADTTNALEKVAEAFYAGNKALAEAQFNAIKHSHLSIAQELLVKTLSATQHQLANFFTEVEWLLHDKPVRSYDYYYDQIVCAGELLSTAIVSAYLLETGIGNQWIDIRDIMRTDNVFREASIEWEVTSKAMQQTFSAAFQTQHLIITQGFIGATDQNESTTLGREGSDYSAAVIANMLDAAGVTIWKDVEGIMSADPKKFPEAVYISQLNYQEVISMAYYGAKVIHPKTIRPLQNKNIPLYVKCFLDAALPGTLIHHSIVKGLPPLITHKENQVLLQLSLKNFSFVEEHAVGQLYLMLESLHIKPNITQNGAISYLCCIDDQPERLEKLALAAAVYFEVQVEKSLTLLTIRHYQNNLIEKHTTGYDIILRQQSPHTVHLLMRERGNILEITRDI